MLGHERGFVYWAREERYLASYFPFSHKPPLALNCRLELHLKVLNKGGFVSVMPTGAKRRNATIPALLPTWFLHLLEVP